MAGVFLPRVYAQAKPVAVIPFELLNGSIVLKVKINDYPRPLRLLFDTGADGMAVDKLLADSIGLKISRSHEATVVGGSMKIDVSQGNTITLEKGFQLKNQGIAIFPQMSKDVDGLIGNKMTQDYVVKVDFNRAELSLYSFDNYEQEKGSTVIPFTIPEGLFIIPGIINVVKGQSHRGNFVFDTGANYNLICFRPFVRQNKLLVSGFKSEYQTSTVSMGVNSPTFNGNSDSFSFANTPPLQNMPVTLMAGGGQNESWNPGFDGSIGMGIISRYNFIIHRKKQEIYLTPNHSYNYPFDFKLGIYIFRFNLKGQLEVQGLIAPETQDTLARGTIITRINDVDVSLFLKDAKYLDGLKNVAPHSIIRVEYLKGNKKETLSLPK